MCGNELLSKFLENLEQKEKLISTRRIKNRGEKGEESRIITSLQLVFKNIKGKRYTYV